MKYSIIYLIIIDILDNISSFKAWERSVWTNASEVSCKLGKCQHLKSVYLLWTFTFQMGIAEESSSKDKASSSIFYVNNANTRDVGLYRYNTD